MGTGLMPSELCWDPLNTDVTQAVTALVSWFLDRVSLAAHMRYYLLCTGQECGPSMLRHGGRSYLLALLL